VKPDQIDAALERLDAAVTSLVSKENAPS